MPRLVFALVLATAATALAFVLPGWSVLRRMMDNRDELDLSVLQVEGVVAFGPAGRTEAQAALGLQADEAELQADASFFLKVPGRCRFEISSAESGKSAAAVLRHGKARVEGAEVKALAAALAQVCPILGARSTGDRESLRDLERHLSSAGVEYRKSSLARFGGQVVYVLGEVGPGKPQLWVYKDSFHPARVRWADERGNWDVQFIDFLSPINGDWFPRVVEVRHEEGLALRFTSRRSDAKSRLDDKLF